MLEAAASDQEVAAWCAEQEKRRRDTLPAFLQIALEEPIPDLLLDAVWILTSPDTYTRLTTQCGWSRSTWEDTMTEVISRLAT